ncbi:hypothetical protein [Streptomyces pseudogriseolus]|uniref:ATP-binding protein n=1 Tax=Streptomyces pseudogriseolus TaxID=36817 RepID=UPI003475109C
MVPVSWQATTSWRVDMEVRRAAHDMHRAVAVSPCLPEGEKVHASGLRISDTLILTVAHVLMVNGSCASRARVFLAKLPTEPLIAEVVCSLWDQPHGLDAAVLRLTDAPETLQSVGPVRWGEYTMSGRYRAIGVGFPGFEARRRTECARTITGVLDTARLSWQETLKLERTDGDYRMTAGHHQADGFSGTVLCSEDRSLAVGMITQHDRSDDRLSVTPARILLANRELRKAMGEEDAPSMVPVALESLLVQPLLPARTPADLLEAGRRVLPLQGAAVSTVEKLENVLSCESRVALLHGPAHSGKTRIAWELVHLLRDTGWNAGFLARTPSDTSDWRKILPKLHRNALLVVDELETRQEQWQQLYDGTSVSAPNVRLLGIARSRDEVHRGAVSITAPDVNAIPSHLTVHFDKPLRRLGIDVDGTAPSAWNARGSMPHALHTSQCIGDAQAHALVSLLDHEAYVPCSREAYQVLLEHEHAYATRALQAKLPWLRLDLCRALLTACAYSEAGTATETIIDVRDTLQYYLASVPGVDLSNPTLADAVSLYSISDTLAQLYPSLDGAHRGRLPEAVRTAQHEHAEKYHAGLSGQLRSNMSEIRTAQADALKASVRAAPGDYAHPAEFRSTASSQPDTPAAAPATPSPHPQHQPPEHQPNLRRRPSTSRPRLRRPRLRRGEAAPTQQTPLTPKTGEPPRPSREEPFSIPPEEPSVPSAQKPPTPQPKVPLTPPKWKRPTL